MTAPMRYETAYGVEREDDDGASLAVVTFHDAPVVAREGRRVLCFWGDLLGDDDAHRLGRGMNEGTAANLPAVLLAAWQRDGIDAICRLNGLYVIAAWDGDAQTLHLITDRFGYRKLYYWESGGRLAFASETKAICALPGFTAKTDHTSLACFMSVTHLLGNRTLFEGVHHVPPGHVATWREGRFDLRQYEQLHFGSADDAIGNDELYQGLAARLRTAVSRAVQPGTGLLLTGGLDSRTLAAALPIDRPANVRAVSLGHGASHDVRFGRSIAHRVDLPHHTVFVPEAYIAEFAERAMDRTEGMATCHGYWNVAPDDVVRRNQLRWLMTGSISSAVRSCLPHWENVGAAYRADGDPESVLRYEYDYTFCSGFNDDALKAALQPAIYQATKGAAWEAVRKTFYEAPTEHPLRRVDYVHIREYERHFISRNFEMFGGIARVCAPFLDRDLFDYSYKTRVNHPMNRNEWVAMLNTHFLRVVGVPRTATGIPLRASAPRKVLHRAMMRFYYHILPGMTGGRMGGRDLARSVQYNEWLRGPMRSFTERTLLQSDALDDLVRKDTVRRIVGRHMSGEGDEYSKISVLLTLAMWRQRYNAQ